jgi:hypothetical protein
LPALTPVAPIDVAALAAEIDPGAQPPLGGEAPAKLRIPNTVDARLDLAEERLKSWAQRTFIDGGSALDSVSEGLALAEPIALGPPSATQRRAALLVMRFCANIRWLWSLRETMRALYRMVNLNGGNEGVLPSRILDAADKVSAHWAAMLLRDPESSPVQLAEAIELAANLIERDQRWEHVRDLRADAMRRRAGKADADTWLGLAGSSYMALDLQRGDEALAHADRVIESMPRGTRAGELGRRARLTRTRAQVADIKRLDGATALDDRLLRILRLCELGRIPDAESALQKLYAEPLYDARPRTLGVFAAFGKINNERLDFNASVDLLADLDKLAALPNRDRVYWSVRIGLLGLKMASRIGMLLSDEEAARVQFRQLAKETVDASHELGRFEPGRAAVLGFLIERAVKELDRRGDGDTNQRMLAVMLDAFEKGRELTHKYPETADAWALLYAPLVTQKKPRLIFSLLDERPNVSPQVLLVRAQVYFSMVTRWDWSRIRRLRQVVDQVPEEADSNGEIGLLRADIAALEATRDGSTAAWQRAADAYEAVTRASFDSKVIPRLLNNWGQALLRAGKVDTGLAKLKLAEAGSSHKWVPRLNALVASEKDTLKRVAKMSAVTDDSDTRAVGWAWAAAVAQTAGDKRAPQFAREAVDGIGRLFVEGKVCWGADGLYLDNNFQLSLGASSSMVDYVLKVAVTQDMWLVAPPPLSEAKLRELAKVVNK